MIDLNSLHPAPQANDGTLLQTPNNLFFQKKVKRRPGTKPGTISLVEQLNREASPAGG